MSEMKCYRVPDGAAGVDSPRSQRRHVRRCARESESRAGCAGGWQPRLAQLRVRSVRYLRVATLREWTTRSDGPGSRREKWWTSLLQRWQRTWRLCHRRQVPKWRTRPRRPGKSSSRAFRGYAGDLRSPTDSRGVQGGARVVERRVSDTLQVT